MTINEFYRKANVTAEYMPYADMYIVTVRFGDFVGEYGYTSEWLSDSWEALTVMRAEIYHAFLKWFKGDDDALV